VISPLLRGLFGLQTDAVQHKVVFSPHLPPDWASFAIHNLHAGEATLDFVYRKNAETIELAIESTSDASLEFSPSASPHTRILGAELNSSRVPFQISKSAVDQHIVVRTNISKGKNILRIRMKNDFGISYDSVLPPLGSSSLGLRLISDSWLPSGDEESLVFAGAAGTRYELALWNAGQIASVDGAEIRDGRLVLSILANSSAAYPRQKVVIRFAPVR
jgi:hypothetical protein